MAVGLIGHLHSMGAGALMGMIHAVTGPDHMSALLTLAVNHERCAAAWLGIRWGVGHSLGLLVVTTIVLVLRDTYGVEQRELVQLISHGVDWMVGIIMLALSFWGFRTAWRLRRSALYPVPLAESDAASARDRVHEYELPVLTVSDELAASSDGGQTDLLDRAKLASAAALEHKERSSTLSCATESPHAASGGARGLRACTCARACTRSWSCASSRATTPSLVALGVGVIHGIGGPGGVLAVLPTLFIPGLAGSCLYLGAFCASATLTMAVCAFTYGACTHRSRLISPQLPWVLQGASASISLCVGVLWLVCSATDSLEDVLAAMGME